MNNTTVVDVLISNIKEDQMLLNVVEAKMNETKDQKQAIVNRLREQQRDLSVLSKYANEEQQAKIKELGFDVSEPHKNVNSVANSSFDLILKAKDHQLTNNDWYEAYVKNLPKNEEALNYTAFNIKCRTLFNTQKLIRTKSKDATSSREDIISLNGQVRPAAKKEEKSVSEKNKTPNKKDDKPAKTTK
ncbi:hypothetical protein [Polaribacter cellanae]|uniref:Uncharacterized protein n=1 Tax=Polaribacter cellanae TaxID=2818493 RepID=A0A975H5M9_9FLAO|nr:hypothetical protein [Polaribacter cellanae]QTE21103.1 hypothetical protein J3359_09595 [Polaribacter cellanae]